MREIKFRVYDKKEKKMIYHFPHARLDYALLYYETHHHVSEPMEYTGLKDKNGKDIYENDIVSRFGGTQKSVVTFKDGCFVSIIQDSGLGKPHYDILCNSLDVTEITGNIYEKPEILNSGAK